MLFRSDTTAPTFTLEQGAAQADPAKSSPIVFTLTGSEALAGGSVSSADFDVVNGTVSAISCSGSACTVSVTPAGQGLVSIAAATGFSVTDVAGNAGSSVGSTDAAVTYDSVAPTLTLRQAMSQPDPTTGASIRFRLVSSEVAKPGIV